MLDAILWPVIALGGLGLVLGLGLAIASKIFAVETDPNVEKVRELLPGANCGGCGFPGCDGFAKAVAEGKADASKCVAIRKENLVAIGAVLGVEIKEAKDTSRACCAAAIRRTAYPNTATPA
jgi:electron transport complex protein RnfB